MSGIALMRAERRRVSAVFAVAIVLTVCASAAVTSRASGATMTTPFGFGFTSFQNAFIDCPRDNCEVDQTTGGFPEVDTVDTQAGSHPDEATFEVRFKAREQERAPIAEVREIVVNLPVGLVADPHVTPRCTREQLDRGAGECPADTQVGTVQVALASGRGAGAGVIEPEPLPLYNMVPPSNQPAQFGLIFKGTRQFFDTSVRTDGDYGISVRVPNITESELARALVSIWGLPADPSHDRERQGTGNGCGPGSPTGHCASDAPLKPFWTMPTACGGPLTTTATADAWGREAELAEVSFLTESEGLPFGYTGCEHLRFTPSVSITPGSADAETPTGLSVELKEPQEGVGDPVGVSQSDIKTTTVALPEGVAVNPGAAAGLAACQLSEDGVGTTGPSHCPTASKLGTVTIATPLLTESLEGNVYLLQSSPPDVKLLISAYAAGQYVKLVGDVTLNEHTGQATATFAETPQFPLSDVKISFGGGPKAALVTPPRCGMYGASSDFTPWSTPFVANVSTTDDFPIDAGPGGGPCVVSQLPFAPTLTAGSTSDQAGGYTSFSMLLRREDGQQQIANLQFKTPEGLLGKISSVTPCEEPRAAQGDCPGSSQIGHTVVGAGPGAFPLFVPEPGRPPAPIYLTGPYEGAPYGLAVAVPVIAGPFNLGVTVVRAKIEIDPHTSRLTIAFNPKTLPTILDGIPTDIRDIDAVLDRPEFMFNPTSCAPMSFTGTAYSTEGASAPLSSRFQVGSCRSLKFNPNFKASTQGRTSRVEGASLTVKLIYPTGALGANQASSQSNLQSVKVELPKQLPARLTTLRKACLAAVFEANPAACPPDSIVGRVRVLTPVLSVPLTGPAYFVSHGGEAFPSLVLVLQGSGVTIDLEGTTFISKTDITSSTFKNIPDVPISLFELTLPEGPYSALTTDGSLCRNALEMPSEFVAESGAVIVRHTRLVVTGCPKAAKPKAKKRRRGRTADRARRVLN